jgi:hypothetical protein
MNPAEWLAGGLRTLAAVGRRLPLSGYVAARIAEVERVLVGAVRDHLNGLDDTPALTAASEDAVDTPPDSPGDVLHELMRQSMYTTPNESRDMLNRALVRALLPDEVRILAALADGSAFPVIHVVEGRATTNPTSLLRNASTVGRAAGVSLPQQTPWYLTRLLHVGLAVIGPEDTAQRDEYEMLLTDTAVNAALRGAGRGVLAARVIRRTVVLSDLGRQLWEAAK